MVFLTARKAQLAALAGEEYAKRYRQRADTCRKQSERAEDPSSRSIFLRLAVMYQDMANQFTARAEARNIDHPNPLGSGLNRSNGEVPLTTHTGLSH